VDRNDPNVRRVMARQLWLARELRKEGKTLDTGKPYTDSSKTDVRRLFALYDWTPPSEARS